MTEKSQMSTPLFSDLVSAFIDARAAAASDIEQFQAFDFARERLNQFMGTPMPPFVPDQA